jgi:hypothetical protein
MSLKYHQIQWLCVCGVEHVLPLEITSFRTIDICQIAKKLHYEIFIFGFFENAYSFALVT